MSIVPEFGFIVKREKQLEWVATPFSVQAAIDGFVDDNQNGDDEKSMHCLFP